MCVYIYLYTHIYIYICIYIQTGLGLQQLCMYILHYITLYIFIYIIIIYIIFFFFFLFLPPCKAVVALTLFGMSLHYGVDPIGLPKINSVNQSVKPRKSWQSSNTKYYKVLYFILKVRDLFQNWMLKPLIVVIKWKTSKHIIFNHKYTFLFISAYKNITIYSHLKWFTKSTSSAHTLMKRVNCTDLIWCAS